MALKIGNRNQYSFLPPVIDKYVGEDDPVRVYDAFVETLDFEKIGIDINNVYGKLKVPKVASKNTQYCR